MNDRDGYNKTRERGRERKKEIRGEKTEEGTRTEKRRIGGKRKEGKGT